jgi:hypothetical protein
LLLCSSHLPLWVPNCLAIIIIINYTPAIRKPQRKTINDRKLLNQALEAVFVNYVLASMSRAPNKPKYYFSLRGTLPP